MTPNQQKVHRVVWWVLGPLLVAGVVIAWQARPEVPAQAPPTEWGVSE